MTSDAADAGAVVDAGRAIAFREGGDGPLPTYWQWDPALLPASTRNKLIGRRAQGCTNPEIVPWTQRQELVELAACEDADESPYLARKIEDARLRVYGQERNQSRAAGILTTSFSMDTIGAYGPGGVPIILILPALLTVFLGVIVDNWLIVGVIVSALTITGFLARELVLRREASDPLALNKDDHAAITKAYRKIDIDESSSEYDTVLRGIQACDSIAGSVVFAEPALREHRAALNPRAEQEALMVHASSLWEVRAKLGSKPEGESHDARRAQRLHRDRSVELDASTRVLEGRVAALEGYAARLAAIDQQWELQRRSENLRQLSHNIDALAGLDAAGAASEGELSKLGESLDEVAAGVEAYLDALDGPVAAEQRLIDNAQTPDSLKRVRDFTDD